MKQQGKRRKYSKRDMCGLLYILPWLAGVLVFQLYPFAYSFILSFTDKSMAEGMNFVGLQNYITIFTKDKDFWTNAEVTVKYVLMAVPGRVMFALLVALLLNVEIKGINFFRTVYYLPSIFGSSVAISIVWRFMFQKQGMVNELLGLIGVPGVNWFGDPGKALITICIIPIWQFGSSMVLFLAALKNVPRSLYDSAQIDGAGKVSCFFRITLPMISPIMLFNLVMQAIGCFQEFSTAFVLTKGGPNKATFLYGIKIYREAFTNFKMGYASALSWILFMAILFVTALIFIGSKKWVFYDE
ncbi:MAG: sugar ABC transporter permease [Lachnospiraceae bacterium]|nr:sugar ABC transporter permease [Lachnospiraceae bacterium]